jgi:PKD repeat protein
MYFELLTETVKQIAMKKIIFLTLVLPIILFSCESFPEAHFFSDVLEPEVGQEVFFTNDSHNANEFEWDFGDGYISNAENPSHIFTGTGSFEVMLTVYSDNGLSDKATMTIDVKIPTLLEIEVVEFYHEYIVPGASVRLYPTLPDWEDQTNLESEGYTDEDGIVVFSHLGPYVYYVDVWETSHDNYQLKLEDVGFIRTDEIMPNKINRFTAWVDSVDHGKGMLVRGDRKLFLKSLERKASDKVMPERSSVEWQALYERSIKVK